LVLKRHLPHLLFSEEPKCKYGELLMSADAIEGYFEWKFIKLVLLLHNNAPAKRALSAQKKLA